MQKDHMPRPANPRRFDAGQWLIWAERLGYRIYLAETGPGGRLGIVTEVPKGPRGDEDMDLWRAFQGQAAQRKINRAALIEHLVKLGRVVRRRAAVPPAVDDKEPIQTPC